CWFRDTRPDAYPPQQGFRVEGNGVQEGCGEAAMRVAERGPVPNFREPGFAQGGAGSVGAAASQAVAGQEVIIRWVVAAGSADGRFCTCEVPSCVDGRK